MSEIFWSRIREEHFKEKNVYFLIHDLFHDFEVMLDDTKANLELRKLEVERTY